MLRDRIRQKLHQKKGETIGETLVALLIACLAMLMLAGALVSASKVNQETKTMDTEFKVEKCSSDSGTVKLTKTDGSSEEVNVTVYKSNDNNKYEYYVVKSDDD